MGHIIEDVFFPRKTADILLYQFGQLLSSKKAKYHNKGQKAKLVI